MHNDNENPSKKLILQAELQEAKRIENYLRAEVTDLWIHINGLNNLPFFKSYIRISSKVQKLIRKNKKSLKKTSDYEDFVSDKKLNISYTDLDIIFVLPTDKIEIGGTQTTIKLVREITNKHKNVKCLALQHDPTSSENEYFIRQDQLDPKSNIKVIIACGAETVNKVEELSAKFKSKSVLLMLGADHYFTPKWIDSKNFTRAIKNFDFVIALSPFLEKLAKYWGSKNIVCAKLGPDLNLFPLNEKLREKLIVVSCRTSIEKGLRVLLPQIPIIQSLGWKVIGFGDLPDNEMAGEFDDFLGRIDAPQLSELFSRAKILLDPSWMEGLGLVALEAASSGCIPIITKRKDYQGIFKENLLPYVEIDNFLDPELVLDAIAKSEANFDSKTIIKSMNNLDWDAGSRVAQEFLLELLNSN